MTEGTPVEPSSLDAETEHHNGPTSPTAVIAAPQGAIEKRRVVMESAQLLGDGTIQRHGVVDFVPVDILDAYVADAQTRWQAVTVPEPDMHDPGPAGDVGDTHYPAHLDHPLAGTTMPGSES